MHLRVNFLSCNILNDVFQSCCRLALDNFFVIIELQSFLFDLIQTAGLKQGDTILFIVFDLAVEAHFQGLQAQENVVDVHLVINFFPDCVYFVAALPLHFGAEDRVHPGVYAVLYISEQVKVALFDLLAVFIEVEGSLGDC